MDFQNILLLITSLVLFLFGLVKLSEMMQQVISVRIRQYIKLLVKRPFQGIIIGTIVTAIFQSSSAVSVLTVSMVGTGLLSFFSSLGVILGANIGTTITAQLVAFRIAEIAPLFIVLGIIFWFFAKNDRQKQVGEVIFYFGLLFFGLSLMGQSIAPFRENPFFINLIKEAKDPFLGILTGFIFTAIIQSSSATTAILVVLAQQGLITITGALPILLGANIGTTITALIASVATGISGKRTAFAHFLFKFLMVVLIFPFIPRFITLLTNLTSDIPQQIATGHFLFSIFLVCFFFFWLKPFAKIVEKIIPGEEKVLALWPEYLDGRYLSNPEKALGMVRKELKRGMEIVQKMFSETQKTNFEFESRISQKVIYTEMVIDGLQGEVMRFLNKIPKEKLTRIGAVELIHYSTIVDKIERIADRITNLIKLSEHKKRNKVVFSDEAKEEIREISDLLTKILKDTVSLLKEKDEQKIKNVIVRRNRIDQKIERSKENHLERFYQRARLAADGPLLNDILINLEQISYHCEDIAKYIGEI